MTHHPIKELPDGTRVYSNRTKYVRMEDALRVYQVRKPNVEGAERWYGDWYLPLEVLAEEDRVMPETRSDEDAYLHMTKARPCKCDICKRPETEQMKELWRQDQAIPKYARNPERALAGRRLALLLGDGTAAGCSSDPEPKLLEGSTSQP